MRPQEKHWRRTEEAAVIAPAKGEAISIQTRLGFGPVGHGVNVPDRILALPGLVQAQTSFAVIRAITHAGYQLGRADFLHQTLEGRPEGGRDPASQSVMDVDDDQRARSDGGTDRPAVEGGKNIAKATNCRRPAQMRATQVSMASHPNELVNVSTIYRSVGLLQTWATKGGERRAPNGFPCSEDIRGAQYSGNGRTVFFACNAGACEHRSRAS